MIDNPDSRRHLPLGKQIRLSRIFGAANRRALVVPLDHSVTIGPLGASGHADQTAAILERAGADALVVHKGRARTIAPTHFGSMGLIVHLSAGTNLAVDQTRKVVVGSVEETVALGADAVSVHVNVGAPTEAEQLTDLGLVAAECDRLGVPLLAMMYARGGVADAGNTSVSTLAHLAAIATDLGADIVKLDYAGSPERMDEVVDTCPLPILVAGGPPTATDDTAIDFGLQVAESRVAGLSFGRLIFGADHPHLVASTLADRLHNDSAPSRPLATTLELA